MVIFGDKLQRDWEMIVSYRREEPKAEKTTRWGPVWPPLRPLSHQPAHHRDAAAR